MNKISAIQPDTLRRKVEDAVRDRLAHPDAGDRRDHVVEALDVLDVERREHVDAGSRAHRVPRLRVHCAGP